jgi:hypothetical protein
MSKVFIRIDNGVSVALAAINAFFQIIAILLNGRALGRYADLSALRSCEGVAGGCRFRLSQ